MNNQTPQQIPLTYEAMMAFIYECNRYLTEKQAETDRILTEKFTKTDRILTEKFTETDRILTEKFAKTDRMLTEQLAETDRILTEQLAETRQIQKENEQLFKEQIAENERIIKEKERLLNESTIKSDKEYEKSVKRMKKIEELLGSWANNFGSFAEEYFFNSFENEQQNFFGEHFNEIRKKVKPKGKKLEDEYDIVMYNDSSVAIVEVKSKAHKNDVQKVIKKAETFRILCPDYSDFNIYLGLASLSFYDELEQECVKNGIAIIKQVGDTVIINDEHLKVY